MRTLTAREREVAQLVSAGLRNKQIAQQLGISCHTVRAHMKNVFYKLGVHNRTQVATIYLGKCR